MKYIIAILRFSIFALLIYTATIKIDAFDSHLAFVQTIGFLPAKVAYSLAVASILVEGGVAIMILLPYKWAKVWACSTLIILMLLYSYVVYHAVYIAPFLPCSCRGIHEKISWSNHHWVNGAIAGICLGMLYYYRSSKYDRRSEQFFLQTGDGATN